MTVTFSGAVSNGIVAGAADFAGVDQSDPLGTAVGAGSPDNADTALGVDLTGLNGDELVFDNVFAGATDSTQTLTRRRRTDRPLERLFRDQQRPRRGQHRGGHRQLGHHELDGRDCRLLGHRGRADQPAAERARLITSAFSDWCTSHPGRSSTRTVFCCCPWCSCRFPPRWSASTC